MFSLRSISAATSLAHPMSFGAALFTGLSRSFMFSHLGVVGTARAARPRCEAKKRSVLRLDAARGHQRPPQLVLLDQESLRLRRRRVQKLGPLFLKLRPEDRIVDASGDIRADLFDDS